MIRHFCNKKKRRKIFVLEKRKIEKEEETRLYVSVAGGRLTNPPQFSLSPTTNVERGSCDSGGATIAKAGKFKKMNKNLFFYHLKSEILWKNYEDIFYLFKKEEVEKAKGYEPFCSNRKEIEEEEDLISSCVHKRSRHK